MVVRKQGYLIKEGQWVRSWKRRWFTLEGTFLLYFESPQSVAQSVAKSEREFCFEIQTPQRTYYAVADSREDMDDWIEKLNYAVGYARGNMTPDSIPPSPLSRKFGKPSEMKVNKHSAADDRERSDTTVSSSAKDESIAFFNEFEGIALASKVDRGLFDFGLRIPRLPDEEKDLMAHISAMPGSKSKTKQMPRSGSIPNDDDDDDDDDDNDDDSDEDEDDGADDSAGNGESSKKPSPPMDRTRSEAYCEAVYSVLHRVGGVSDPECVSSKLLDYCQRAFAVTPAVHRSSIEQERLRAPESRKSLPKGVSTRLRVMIVQGRNLAPKDKTGKSDPFCELGIADSGDGKRKQKCSTTVKPQTLEPVWSEEFVFDISSPEEQVFMLQMWDEDEKSTFSMLKKEKNDFMGIVQVPIKSISPGGSDNWYTLQKRTKKSHVSGEVRIRFNFDLGADLLSSSASSSEAGSASSSPVHSSPSAGGSASGVPAFRGSNASAPNLLLASSSASASSSAAANGLPLPPASLAQSAVALSKLEAVIRRIVRFEAKAFFVTRVTDLDVGTARWSGILSPQAVSIIDQVALQQGVSATLDRLMGEIVSIGSIIHRVNMDFGPLLTLLLRVSELQEELQATTTTTTNNNNNSNSNSPAPASRASIAGVSTPLYMLSLAKEAQGAQALKKIANRLVGTLLKLRDVYPCNETAAPAEPSADPSSATAARDVPSSVRLQHVLAALKTIYASPLWVKYHGEVSLEECITDLLQRHVSYMYRRLVSMARTMDNVGDNELRHISLVTSAIANELQYAAAHYQDVFGSLGLNIVLVFARKYCSLLFNDVSKVTGEASSHFASNSSSSVGGSSMANPPMPSAFLFELYFSLKKLRDELSRKLSRQERSTIDLIYNFHVPFRAAVTQWIIVSGYKTDIWILNALKEDKIETVGTTLFSSSVIDMFICFDQVFTFLSRLDWPDPAEANVHMALMAEIISKGIKLYADSVRRDLDRRVGSSEGGGGSGAQPGLSLFSHSSSNALASASSASSASSAGALSSPASSGQFDVSRKLCVLLNNIEQTETKLRGLYSSMESIGIVDSLTASQQQMGSESPILYLFNEVSVHLRDVLQDLVAVLTRKMSPDIYNYLGNITGTLSSSMTSSWLERAISSVLNSPPPAEVAAPVSKEEVEAAIEPLLQYLSSNLETLSDSLYHTIFQRVLHEIWLQVVLTITEIVTPGMETHLAGTIKNVKVLTPRQSTMFELALQILHDFFHADGDGIPLGKLDIEEYRALRAVLRLYNTPTDQLISKFMELEVCASRKADAENYGEIELELTLTLKGEGAVLLVNVIRANNIPPMDKDGRADPYVEIAIRPRQMGQQVFHSCKQERTKTKLKTLAPVYNQSFSFTIEKWDPILILQISMFDFDLIGGDDFIGDAVIRLTELPDGSMVRDTYKLNRGDGCGELENIALLLGARSKKDANAREFIQKRSTALAQTPLVLNLIKLPIQILDPRNNPLIKLIVSKASC